MTALDNARWLRPCLRTPARQPAGVAAHKRQWQTLVVVLTPILLASACRSEPAPPAEPAAEAAAAQSPGVVLDPVAVGRAGITTEAVRQIERRNVTPAPGLVALNDSRTARIGSLIDGVVIETKVAVGDRVRANQLLASLHSHAVHDAWAGYRNAKADERRLVNELTFVSDALGRAERLYAAKALALQELQRAQANRVAAVEALEIGRSEVKRSEEELEHLGITNGEAPAGAAAEQVPVRTPFAGVVIERLVTSGTAVIPGMSLFIVSDLSNLWVLAELDEAHVAAAQIGQPVTVRVPAYPDEEFEGRVTYVDETVNPKTRRVTIRCEVPNRDGRLKPEMYATVEIGENESRTIAVVPSTAVQTVNGQTVVFVKEGTERFVQKPVTLGPERDGLVEVRDGVRAGETVVTSGAFVLKSELLKSTLGE